MNRYGCGLLPDTEAWGFGSSTASVISHGAYEAVARLARSLDAGPGAPSAYAAATQAIRARLAALCGMPEAADDIVLGASGTDLHLIAAELARGDNAAPLTCVMPDPTETGRGVGHAVRSLRYAECTPHGPRGLIGAGFEGLAPGALVSTPLRTAQGDPRPAEAVDADIERACEAAIAADGRAMLVVVDVSKTGLVAPSPACAARLKRRYGEALTVLIDACQFRISSETLADYLAQDFLVGVTGSKFVGGPAFSGALLIPPASAGRLRDRPLPAGLSESSGRQDWPETYRGREGLEDRANLGLLLRWEAALHELEAFRACPQAEIDRFTARFAAHVAEAIARQPSLRYLPAPALVRARPGAWDANPTIFPFLVLDAEGPLSPARLHTLYDRLKGRRPAVHLGQPVPVGGDSHHPLGALRLSLSARLVVEALSSPACEAAVLARADAALALTAEMAGAV